MKDEPALPSIKERLDNTGRLRPEMHGGLTKREYFAAMAMQGFAANSYYLKRVAEHSKPMRLHVAEDAVEFADALIKELENE